LYLSKRSCIASLRRLLKLRLEISLASISIAALSVLRVSFNLSLSIGAEQSIAQALLRMNLNLACIAFWHDRAKISDVIGL